MLKAVRSASWQSAAVRAGLVSLTLLDFMPTAKRQLRDSQAALVVVADGSEQSVASAPRVNTWAKLVRGKVLGELLGLSVALRAPCSGACVVLLSHLLFWRCGAARTRVDAAALPAELPASVAKMISTADAVVLAFAALGALGPTPVLQSAGAALFSVAAAAVSAEAISKAVGRRRAALATPSAVAPTDEAPSTAQGVRARPPKMVEGTAPRVTPRVTDTPIQIDAAAVQAAADAKGASSSAAVSPAEAMNHRIWAEQWWPLCFSAHTSTSTPYAITLLGADLVLWWDEVGGAWRCTLDRCSHRLACATREPTIRGLSHQRRHLTSRAPAPQPHHPRACS
jgi:hypothetical protein